MMLISNLLAILVAIIQHLCFLFLLGVPIYFIWRWFVTKFIKSEKKRKRFVLIGSLLATPLIYMTLTTSLFMGLSYHPSRDFDSENWFADEENRYELSADIIQSKMLIGKTKSLVRQILGDEGHKDESDRWMYHLGVKPGLGIDPDVLLIDFKDGKVVQVEQH